MALPQSALHWTTNHVNQWLTQNGFGHYAHLFCDIHKINGPALLMLTEEDLKNPLNIQILGDLKNLSLHLFHLQTQHKTELNKIGFHSSPPKPMLALPFKNSSYPVTRKRMAEMLQQNSETLMQFSMSNSHYINRDRESSPTFSESSLLVDDGNFSSPADGNPASPGMAVRLEPERWKAMLSISYFVVVTIITSLVMVIVHDRVPDMKKYPPLPDIFLDNVPLIPWAFDMCEVTGCLLLLTWIVVLVCHKHRFILMRRFFALTGTVFLLRCVTMMITSLSVPGSHLECAPRPYGNIWAKLEKALEIWRGFGMSVRGVRTCGDYMFSGHTVTLTMLNFFITEYTPRRVYFLHTFTWILNLFGIFFILAAREHYSIDVFVAFYITSRVFLYYHSLANSRALRSRDRYRARIWFPLFSFFESRVDGMVPNEYQMPWSDFSIVEIRAQTCKLIHHTRRIVGLDKKLTSGNKKIKKKN